MINLLLFIMSLLKELSLLRKSAQLVSNKFKDRNLKAFLSRRINDRIHHVESLENKDEIDSEVLKIKDMLAVAERQIYVQNLNHKEDSVLDDQ